MHTTTVRLLAVAALALAATAARAQAPHNHEFYLSWGYNGDTYAPTDISFRQKSLGNDFTLEDVHGHDNKGWTNLFAHAPTIPQYSWRIGYFVSRKHDLAIELNYDHPKFIVRQGQEARMKGTLNGSPVDSNVVLTPDVLKYKLNNGANFVLFDVVKRVRLHGQPGKTGSLAFLGRAGVGFLLPHTDNTLFGVRNSPGFQFGGFDTGLEAALRLHIYRRIFTEFSQKTVYARYTGLHINEGEAAQNLWSYTYVLSLGYSFNISSMDGAKAR